MTPAESLGDDLESPASPELLPTPTRKKPGRKPKQKRLVSRPKPQPKPAEAAVGAGTEATGDVLNDAGGEIKESAFFNIPQEIRNRIYRHLLVSRNPIQVKQLWTEPARQKARRMPRRRGAAPEKLFNEETDMGIDPRILCVSKQAYLEGSRILYSENTFHYMLRDPKCRARAHTSLSPTGPNQINFAKYCHLFRHISIELEPNRTDHDHERLLERSLECLARADGSSSPSSSRANSPASRIFLDTLTLTITPVKPVKIPLGNMPGGRSRIPTAIKFFSRNSVADRLLRRINTRSIRFNIHVEPHREDEDSDDESDDDDLGLDGSGIVRIDGTNNLRHLETTIDLRFSPRYMNQAADVPKVIRVYPDEFWQADRHILAKRAMVGQRAEYALAELHSRLWEAWMNPDQAVRDGLWEDHGVAEQRRRINRAKHQVKFDCDALLFQKRRKKKTKTVKKGKESLIISIGRHGGAIRAFRAN
ncbi:hypothetical protein QBC37DRAFT_277998 [Rhypophila decipiens]|uniref:Uncharacterized protein n=1 Tax=Rhypophila decipiens TaxID=261697 RepID=A0AAN6YI51_9PEZI|nr:hypothetical protein QBC37DRAFT_277998 [Rhypophila decipiens]